MVGDSSVDYIFDPAAAEALRQHAPDAKLIAILRDPIDRAVSAYHWLQRQGLVDAMPLDRALEQALEAFERGSRGGVAQPLFSELIARGLYKSQLDRFAVYNDDSRLHITLFDDIREDPRAALQQMYRFLAVDSTYVPAAVRRRPKATGPLPEPVALERRSGAGTRTGKVIRRIGRVARELAAMAGVNPPERQLPNELEGRLRLAFAETYDLLDSLRFDGPSATPNS